MGWRLLAGGSRRQGNSISSRGGPWCRRRLRGTASSGLGGCSAQCRLGLWDRVVSGHGSLGGVPFWGGGGSREFHLGHHDDHKVLLIDAVFTDGDVIAQDLPGIYKLLPSHGEGIAALLCLDLLLQCPHLGAQGVRGDTQTGSPKNHRVPPKPTKESLSRLGLAE